MIKNKILNVKSFDEIKMNYKVNKGFTLKLKVML